VDDKPDQGSRHADVRTNDRGNQGVTEMSMTELVPDTRAQAVPTLFTDLTNEMNQMTRWMDRFFARPTGFTPLTRWASAGDGITSYPSVDVWEKPEQIDVLAEVPGYTLNNIHIHAGSDNLIIEGERPAQAPQDAAQAHQQMGVTGAGKFRIALRLPCEVDLYKTEARLADGILKVQLPKAHPDKAGSTEIKILPGS
jgi:HSP20 family molecular chaperone IbpA